MSLKLIFFKNNYGLNGQFNIELWNFHSNLLFCKNLKEKPKFSRKRSKNQHGERNEPMLQHFFNKFPMS